MKQLLLSILLIGGCLMSGFSQTIIKGFVKEVDTEPVINALVEVAGQTTETDENGYFSIQFESLKGNVIINISKAGIETIHREVTLQSGQISDLGIIEAKIVTSQVDYTAEDRISAVTLVSDEIESAQDNQNISGILTASRDVFVNTAAFTFGNARFRIRGYDSENSEVVLNGVPFNELENGRIFWSAWGGLNDVTRNRQNTFGLEPTTYAFGGVAGASSIDLRASSQRAQTRFSYALSNRSYRQRAMLTYSTGMMQNGWAVSASASTRLGDEGFIRATSYEAYSYFLSIDRKLGKNSTLNFVAFGAPAKRGRSTAAVEEITILKNDNYYNPYWGYQDGEVRNSRISNIHQPVLMLRNDWDLAKNQKLTTAVSYQFGRNGSTTLDWFEAADPRPDYYRNLPSYFATEFPGNPEIAENVAAAIVSGENDLQLDWDSFYEENGNNSNFAVENANGTGNTIQGRFSQYRIIDQRFDSKELNININYENILTDNITLTSGLSIQKHKTENFREIVDLLGGDFFVDWDRFSARDFGGDFLDNDLNNPNNVVREGDKFGYNYDGHIQKNKAWVQGQFSYNKVDFFLGASYVETRIWRDGHFRNGRFPNSSEGVSAKKSFTNGSVKGGVTYKLDGRNYLYANGMYQTRAPFYRNAYISPRTRQDLVPNLTSETITSVEGGYVLRGVNLNGRISGYLTDFKDQTRVIRFFTDVELESEFINYILTDIDSRNLGLEFALTYKINASLSVTGVAAYGQYFYTNRPTRFLFNDIDAPSSDLVDEQETVYMKNFRKPGMPQQAYSFAISYNPKPLYLFGGQQRIFANLNFNYFDDIYLDFSPERRTADAVDGVEPGSELFNDIIEQEKLSGAFTMDFFGGISFSRKLRMTIGVNNLLDKTDFRTGGYEQLRFDLTTKDTNQFPPRYFYSFGRNYFVSLNYTL